MGENGRTVKVLSFLGQRIEYVNSIVHVGEPDFLTPQKNHMRRRPNAYKRYHNRYKRKQGKGQTVLARKSKRRKRVWFNDEKKYLFCHRFLAKRFYMKNDAFSNSSGLENKNLLLPVKLFSRGLKFLYRILSNSVIAKVDNKFLIGCLGLQRVLQLSILSTERELEIGKLLRHLSNLSTTEVTNCIEQLFKDTFIVFECFHDQESYGSVTLIYFEEERKLELICHFLVIEEIKRLLTLEYSEDTLKISKSTNIIIHGDTGMTALLRYLKLSSLSENISSKFSRITNNISVISSVTTIRNHSFNTFNIWLDDPYSHKDIIDFLHKQEGVLFGLDFHHSLLTSCSTRCFPIDYPGSKYHNEYWIHKTRYSLDKMKKLPLSKVGFNIRKVVDVSDLFAPRWDKLINVDEIKVLTNFRADYEYAKEDMSTTLVCVLCWFPSAASGKRRIDSSFHIVYNGECIGYVTSVNGKQNELFRFQTQGIGFILLSKACQFLNSSAMSLKVEFANPKLKAGVYGTRENNMPKSSKGLIKPFAC